LGFDDVLPVCWMASVLYRDDIAPNQLTFPCSGVSEFRMNFPCELSIGHDADAWQLPNYDARMYAVTVGFGLGLGIAGWAYSVPGQPGLCEKAANPHVKWAIEAAGRGSAPTLVGLA
jgi:hypothetical protein